MRALPFVFYLALTAPAFSQGAVLQAGPTVQGRAPMYVGQGSSQAVVQDSGPAGGGAAGLGLSELGLTKRGTGVAPYAGQGSGEFGTTLCDRDAPINNATGYHFLCLDPNAQGGGLIAYGAAGGASQLPFSFIVNGTQYQFPFSIGGILGPGSTTLHNVPCWGNTVGTLLENCAKQPPVGPATTISGNVSCYGDVTGTLLANCAKQPVIGPVTSVVNEVVCWNNLTGTLAANCTAASDFWVASTGSDTNNCLTVGTPCLTLQHALDLAVRQYFQGNNITVHVGAGTFGPGAIGGVLTGSASGSILGARISIIGAGSGSTTINAGSCAATSNALAVGSGMQLFIGSMTVTTSCTGGNGILVFNRATGGLADGDVTFGSANNAQIQVSNYSTFTGANALNIKFTGASTFGFLLTTHSTAILSTNANHTMQGVPSYGQAFVDAIDGSFFDSGLNSLFVGTATGSRYLLNINSFIDTEQNTNPLPGSLIGTLGMGSNYFQQSLPCVGGAALCPVATAPTGLGGTGTAVVFANSTDRVGMIQLNPSAGAAVTGVVHISTRSQLTNCVVSLSQANGPWPITSVLQAAYTPSTTSPDLAIMWNTNGIALTGGGTYDINYVCG